MSNLESYLRSVLIVALLKLWFSKLGLGIRGRNKKLDLSLILTRT